MLAYVLALAVGFGSIALYMAAFFFPEIHRKNDFIWSGVGLFYALVLWVFAQRITGGFLLGHVASVTLLGWFGWQTLSLRRQLTPRAQQTPIPSTEAVQNSIQQQVSKLPFGQSLTQFQQRLGSTFSGDKNQQPEMKTTTTPETPTTNTTAPPAPTEKPLVEVIDERTPVPPQSPEAVTTTDTQATTDSVIEAIPPHPPSPEAVDAAKAEAEVEVTPPPVEDVAPDATLAPPAEAPPDKLPPNSPQ
jgi:hypothetical protein